jgi:hypothetical protein
LDMDPNCKTVIFGPSGLIEGLGRLEDYLKRRG